MQNRSLDDKVRALHSAAQADAFILADAKDADMAFGLGSCGTAWPETEGQPRRRTLQEFEQIIRQIVDQGLVDIMLVSARTADRLARAERLFDGSQVTPAVRMNDSTDLWLAGNDYSYQAEPSLPFSTASIPHAMGGSSAGAPAGEAHVDLGLYSITLNHDAELDQASLNTYRQFRHEAEQAGFRHFLEVFPPNAPRNLAPQDTAAFVADSIVRVLAGVVASERPLFLKIPYLGQRLMTELCEFDTSMIVGIMGGSAGTTHDAFQLLAASRACGARAALFGRKINRAENQLTFIQHLRWVADGEATAEDAVKSYHAELERQKISPRLPLAEDLELTAASRSLGD